MTFLKNGFIREHRLKLGVNMFNQIEFEETLKDTEIVVLSFNVSQLKIQSDNLNISAIVIQKEDLYRREQNPLIYQVPSSNIQYIANDTVLNIKLDVSEMLSYFNRDDIKSLFLQVEMEDTDHNLKIVKVGLLKIQKSFQIWKCNTEIYLELRNEEFGCRNSK